MYNFIRENIDIINMIIQAIIGAVTAGALIVAIKNIKMNRDQYEDEKKNNSEKELKIQAEKIAAWFEEKRIPPDQLSKRRTQAFKDVLIRNNDLLPIYNVVLTVVGQYGCMKKNGEEYPRGYNQRLIFSEIPYGLWGNQISAQGGMAITVTIEIAFTDSRGNSWVRRGNGQLEPLPTSPIEYYNICRPCSWSTPVRVKD